jgi:hypothetical protein
VGRFFFQSPEVCQKLGRQPEFLSTGDFTTVAARVRGRWHPTPASFAPPKIGRLNPHATRHICPKTPSIH